MDVRDSLQLFYATLKAPRMPIILYLWRSRVVKQVFVYTLEYEG